MSTHFNIHASFYPFIDKYHLLVEIIFLKIINGIELIGTYDNITNEIFALLKYFLFVPMAC